MKSVIIALVVGLIVLVGLNLAWQPPQGDLTWNFIQRVVNFAIILLIIVVALRKPIPKLLGARREGIKLELEALEIEKEESAKAKAEAAEMLTKAEEESQRLMVEYRSQAELERTRILNEVVEQIKHMHEQARLTIEREMNMAHARLKKELALAAVLKAEEILRKQVNSQDQDRLNNEFIANLPQDRIGI